MKTANPTPDFLYAPEAIALILRAGAYVASKKYPPNPIEGLPVLKPQPNAMPSAEVSA